jgi:hypothetical protein
MYVRNPFSNSNFVGYFYHAPVEGKRFHDPTGVVSCTDNFYDLPIPVGYTAEFGAWLICESQGCPSFTFAPETAKRSRTRPLGVPASPTTCMCTRLPASNSMESYAIGQVMYPKKKKDLPFLEFQSPFQNGFVYPANDQVGLEIVHPSQ